jgi:nucleoside-diphosphate-sugar epimerase
MGGAPTILVTGANGFIGTALCENLRGQWRVRGSVRDRPAMIGAVNLEIVEHDVSPGEDWSGALGGVSVVIHVAARVHVMKEFVSDPRQAFESVNFYGTVNLARQAAEAGAKRFIFLSSIGVNGIESHGQPISESSEINPHSDYARSKLLAEDGLKEIAQKTGMEVVIIRPPLVYGPAAPGNFAALIRWVASGIPLPLAAVTKNRRSFVFVDNLVDLIRVCLDHPAAANQTFVVSDGENLSTAALLRRMGDALERSARLIPVPVSLLRMGARLLGKRDMAQRLCGSLEVDISKTKELLGWEPPVSVDEGLWRTAAHWLTTEGAAGK